MREEPQSPPDPDEAADEGPATDETREPSAAAEPERPSTPPSPSDRAEGGGQEPRAEAGPPASEEGPGEPADFGQFLLSLGAQAGMLLSGQGLPEGVDPSEGLAGARSLISILEMLKEKTEGRRSGREDEILEGLLFELRMAYVEKSRAGGS